MRDREPDMFIIVNDGEHTEYRIRIKHTGWYVGVNRDYLYCSEEGTLYIVPDYARCDNIGGSLVSAKTLDGEYHDLSAYSMKAGYGEDGKEKMKQRRPRDGRN